MSMLKLVVSFACALRLVCSRLCGHQEKQSLPRTLAGDQLGVRPRALTTMNEYLKAACPKPHVSALDRLESRFKFKLNTFCQVVVMEGMNATGRKLVASKLYEVSYEFFLFHFFPPKFSVVQRLL